MCCSYRGVQLPSFVQMVSPCINGVAAAILGVIHWCVWPSSRCVAVDRGAVAILGADVSSLHQWCAVAIFGAGGLQLMGVCSRYPRCWWFAVAGGVQPSSSVQMFPPCIDCYSTVRGSQPPSLVSFIEVCGHHRGVLQLMGVQSLPLCRWFLPASRCCSRHPWCRWFLPS